MLFFFFKQKTAYELRISDWSSDVCSSDLTENKDVPAGMQAIGAQLAAMQAWLGARDDSFAELKRIGQPTLVVNGSKDVMIPSINTYTLAQHLPNAQLILHPDRTEERRGGKECARSVRSRGEPDH